MHRLSVLVFSVLGADSIFQVGVLWLWDRNVIIISRINLLVKGFISEYWQIDYYFKLPMLFHVFIAVEAFSFGRRNFCGEIIWKRNWLIE